MTQNTDLLKSVAMKIALPKDMNVMNKTAALVLLSALLTGCVVSENQVAVTDAQLRNQHFVLERIDGESLKAGQPLPELRFGEKMEVSGKMCNRFMGSGRLEQGKLTVSKMASTRLLCADSQLNALDSTISAMLNSGAEVDLTANQLTLATATQTLVYQRAAQ